MILPVANYETAVKKLRAMVHEISAVPLNLILNADSVRGPDPFKVLSSTETASPTLNDAFVVFSLDENPEAVYGTDRVDDQTVEVLTSYEFRLHVYGYPSHEVAQKILYGFKMGTVVSRLRDNGIYVAGASAIGSIKEFFNNTLWPRCDITLHVACRNEFNLPDTPDTESFTWPVTVVKA